MEDLRCSICKAPWHPASGHYISERSRWCGPCTKSWVKELCGMQKRRWGGLRFYDHATVPPPAKEHFPSTTSDDIVDRGDNKT